MDQTVVGVILGGFIAALPGLLSVLVTHFGKKAEMKHELHKMDIEIYHKAKLEALENYRKALGRICANDADQTAWGDFKSASDTLDMFVSESTHKTLNTVCDRVFFEHSAAIQTGRNGRPFTIYTKFEEELSSALRYEMNALHRTAFTKPFRCPPESLSIEIPIDESKHQTCESVEHDAHRTGQ